MCRVIQAQLPRNEASAGQAADLVRTTVEEWVPDVDPAAAEAVEEMTRALVTNAVVRMTRKPTVINRFMFGPPNEFEARDSSAML